MDEPFTFQWNRPLRLDSNLLVLYLVGLVDQDLVQTYKRTSHFLPGDFDLLAAIVEKSPKLVVTAGILAETSNLGDALKGRRLVEFRQIMERFVGLATEEHIEAVEIVSEGSFVDLGFADTDILSVSRSDCLVLTADLSLWGHLVGANARVMNFNHLRDVNRL